MKKVKLADNTEVEIIEASDLKTITDSVTALTTGLKKVSEASTSGNAALLKKIEEVGKAGKQPLKKTVDDDVSDRDLEVMSRKEFMGHMLKQVKDIFEEAIKPVKGEVDTTRKDLSEKELAAEIKAAKEAHPDLAKWKDEIGAIMTASPGISIERAYKIARSENSEKAAEMDKEFKLNNGNVKTTTGKNGAGDDGTADDEDGEQGKPKVLGLTPTSGKTVKSDTMSMKDAGQAAWDEVMSGVDLSGEMS